MKEAPSRITETATMGGCLSMGIMLAQQYYGGGFSAIDPAVASTFASCIWFGGLRLIHKWRNKNA